MFDIPADWKSWKIPLGVVVAGLVAFIGTWGYLHSEFVSAQDFRQYQKTVEVRQLERDKRQLEFDILKLEVKQQAYPARFDKIDDAVLKRHKEDLQEVKQQLNEVKAKPQ